MMRLSLLLVLPLLALVPSTALAQDMIGVSWSGSVYTIDSSTGSGSFLGSSGWSSLNSMGRHSSGTIYTFSGGSLIRIDTTTGAGTFVVGTALTDIRGMAFDANNTLYVVQDRGIGNLDDLYTVDITTGADTFVGNTGYPGIQGLTFNRGTLYAWDCGSGSGFGDGLISINTTTGLGTDVNAGIGGTCSEVQALASSPGGRLFGVRDDLYTVDTTSGALTYVGTPGGDIRGAEFTGGGGFTLRLTNSCPGAGPATASVSGATPFGSVAFAYGFATAPGAFVYGGVPCTGIVLDLVGPILAGTVSANASGNASITNPNVPGGACGNVWVQAVDIASCTASNVASYP